MIFSRKEKIQAKFCETFGIFLTVRENINEYLCFLRRFRERICFPNIVIPGLLVLFVLSRVMKCQADLTCPTCPGFPVPVVVSQISCPCCPAHNLVPSRLSCRYPVFVVISWQSCPLCIVQVHLARLTCQADLSGLSCPSVPVPLSYLNYPATAVPSRLSCPGCPVCYHVLTVYSLAFLPSSLIPTFLS